jgi:hypothetical protein
MPSDIIRIAEDVGARIAALRSNGIVCFVGDYVERIAATHRPDKPIDWRVVVVTFRRSTDSQILDERSGKRFVIGVIPAGNREFRF